MNVNGKYVKDENGNVISPITSTESIFYPDGTNLNSNLNDVNGWMYDMRYNLFKPDDIKRHTGLLQPGEHFQTTIGGTGFIVVRCWASYMEQCRIYAYATNNKFSHSVFELLQKEYISGGKCEFTFVEGSGDDAHEWYYINNVGSSVINYNMYILNLCA